MGAAIAILTGEFLIYFHSSLFVRLFFLVSKWTMMHKDQEISSNFFFFQNKLHSHGLDSKVVSWLYVYAAGPKKQ